MNLSRVLVRFRVVSVEAASLSKRTAMCPRQRAAKELDCDGYSSREEKVR